VPHTESTSIRLSRRLSVPSVSLSILFRSHPFRVQFAMGVAVQITPLWVSVTSTPPFVYNCDPTCLLLLPVSSPLPGARFEFLSFEMPHSSVPSYLMSSVHFCACGYWRVKLESNTRDQLDAFLASRNADPEVGMRPQPGPQPQLAGKGMMWDSRRRGSGRIGSIVSNQSLPLSSHSALIDKI
jgi:hypothetical protein